MAKAPSNVDYVQALNPKGYLNNREITNLDGQYLVKGSQNCEIVNQEKVVSRPGYTLVGAAKTKAVGHKSSYDWETSTNAHRSLRMNDDGELEVYFKHAWHLIKQYTALTRAEFYPWWSQTELIDLLLFVIGDETIQMWSGGIAEIASATATTLTMKRYMSGTTYAFQNNGASPDTITDSALGFLDAGFAVGDTIIVAGSASNDGTYVIQAVTAGTITLFPNVALTNEAVGASIILQAPGATWGESRFLTSGTRKVLVNGVEYAYTGGETTGTLTGLTGLSGITSGDLALQAIISSSPATLTGFNTDLISVTNNYVLYGSKTDRRYFFSKSSDYTSFTYTSPLRKPGEGFAGSFDSVPTAFIPDEDLMYVFGRRDDAYKITFALSSDFSGEAISIKKGKTATGQAAISQGACVSIKNAVAFVSFEPTIDTLGNVAFFNAPQAVPLSDPIKNDIEAYDTTDVHGIYYRRNAYWAFPNEGLIAIYNNQYSHWQPPWLIPAGRMALIDLEGDGNLVLCAHSSVGNETYKLRDGYNDNGAVQRIIMAFGYDNYGARFTQKHADEFASELYISDNTIVKDTVVYDYKGATGIREFEIRGDDEQIAFAPIVGGGLGDEPLGEKPLGSLLDAPDDLHKVRVVNETTVLDFFEGQRVYSSESPDARFAVIAYGSNVELADNIPNFIKR